MTPKTITFVLSILLMISCAINVGLGCYAGYLIDKCISADTQNKHLTDLISVLNEFIEEKRNNNE